MGWDISIFLGLLIIVIASSLSKVSSFQSFIPFLRSSHNLYFNMIHQGLILDEAKSFDENNGPTITLTFQSTITHRENITTQLIYDKCVDFCWRKGGGLWFVPSPIILEDGNKRTGEGMERMILPVFLREKIIEGYRPCGENDEGRIIYKVMNPSLLTFYPVTYHRGEIIFQRVQDDIYKLKWIVKVCPIYACEGFVRFLTKFIVAKYIENLVDEIINLPK